MLQHKPTDSKSSQKRLCLS